MTDDVHTNRFWSNTSEQWLTPDLSLSPQGFLSLCLILSHLNSVNRLSLCLFLPQCTLPTFSFCLFTFISLQIHSATSHTSRAHTPAVCYIFLYLLLCELPSVSLQWNIFLISSLDLSICKKKALSDTADIISTSLYFYVFIHPSLVWTLHFLFLLHLSPSLSFSASASTPVSFLSSHFFFFTCPPHTSSFSSPQSWFLSLFSSLPPNCVIGLRPHLSLFLSVALIFLSPFL